MSTTEEKTSPWKDAKATKARKGASSSKELWSTPKKAKEKAEKAQKFKSNNPSSYNQSFDSEF